MSASMQNTCTGELSTSPREVDCVTVASFLFLFTWRKVRFTNTKLLLEKQKVTMGIKDNPASCHQVELPNQNCLCLCTFHLFFHLQEPARLVCPETAIFLYERAPGTTSHLYSCSSPSHSHHCTE